MSDVIRSLYRQISELEIRNKELNMDKMILTSENNLLQRKVTELEEYRNAHILYTEN